MARVESVSVDAKRIAELEAQAVRTKAEEFELSALRAGLPAAREGEQKAEDERKRIYKRLDDLDSNQWKSVMELLRQHGFASVLAEDEPPVYAQPRLHVGPAEQQAFAAPPFTPSRPNVVIDPKPTT